MAPSPIHFSLSFILPRRLSLACFMIHYLHTLMSPIIREREREKRETDSSAESWPVSFFSPLFALLFLNGTAGGYCREKYFRRITPEAQKPIDKWIQI